MVQQEILPKKKKKRKKKEKEEEEEEELNRAKVRLIEWCQARSQALMKLN